MNRIGPGGNQEKCQCQGNDSKEWIEVVFKVSLKSTGSPMPRTSEARAMRAMAIIRLPLAHWVIIKEKVLPIKEAMGNK